MLESDGLAALVGAAAESQSPPTQAELWRHENVVEQMLAAGPVLPARFGQLLEGEDAVRTLLHERRGPLLAALARLDGAVELAVRAGLRGPAGAAVASEKPASGRAYLLAAGERGARLERLRRQLKDSLGPLAREHRERSSRLAPTSIGAAYLVDRERVGEFRLRVAALDEALEDAGIACTGPWPPYSFVEPARAAA